MTHKHLEISSVRTRLGGIPVLQICENDGECNIFVLYGDGSIEPHTAAYGDARRIVRAWNSHDDLLEALQWFIDDIDGTHTKMTEFDENVGRSRDAIAKATGGA